MVRVLDEGPGIKEDERELIFQRFWRRDRRRAGGAGLGTFDRAAHRRCPCRNHQRREPSDRWRKFSLSVHRSALALDKSASATDRSVHADLAAAVACFGSVTHTASSQEIHRNAK